MLLQLTDADEFCELDWDQLVFVPREDVSWETLNE